MVVEKPDSDHDSAQADGGHNDGKLSHLRWVLIGGAIAVASVVSQKYLYNKTRGLYAASHYVGYL